MFERNKIFNKVKNFAALFLILLRTFSTVAPVMAQGSKEMPATTFVWFLSFWNLLGRQY